LDTASEMLLDARSLEAATRGFATRRSLMCDVKWRDAPFFDSTAVREPHMMTDSVLDILIYVFDRYMLDEVPEVPQRETLARDLAGMGFADHNVERALDWLADLACVRERALLDPAVATSGGAVRVFSDSERARLSTECRGFLFTLERLGVLQPLQREIVIDRMIALDTDELDTEQLKWVVLMVLSSQPGQDLAFQRLEAWVSSAGASGPH
jgi:Smg protein